MADRSLQAEVHPAPHRRNASRLALGFGLAAAPLAWSAQTIVGYALASHSCFPGDTPRTSPLSEGTWRILLAINIAALIISVLGGAVAYRSWSATREERGGRLAHLVEGGEGRTRFLAMCGILVSLGFLVATIFTLVAILLVPSCR